MADASVHASDTSTLAPQTTEEAVVKAAPPSSGDLKLDNKLFVVVALVLISLIAILSVNLYFQYNNYRLGIGAALRSADGVSHVAVLSYSRAWDFATVKTSALFLSFLLVFIGCLYVLRSAETKFEINGEKGDIKGALSLSSPGLALVFFGVFLTSVVIFDKSSMEYNSERTLPNQSQSPVVKPEVISPESTSVEESSPMEKPER